jgi:hypothetical protein
MIFSHRFEGVIRKIRSVGNEMLLHTLSCMNQRRKHSQNRVVGAQTMQTKQQQRGNSDRSRTVNQFQSMASSVGIGS